MFYFFSIGNEKYNNLFVKKVSPKKFTSYNLLYFLIFLIYLILIKKQFILIIINLM